MLNFFFFSPCFYKACHSGFYIDYFIKKIIEVLVKNIFIYSAIFFGEKFIIEYFTKKLVESCIFYNNNNFNFFNFFHSFFFLYNISALCLFLSLLNIFFLLI